MAEWTEEFTELVKRVIAEAQDKQMCAMVNTSIGDDGQPSYIIVLSPNPLNDGDRTKIEELAKSIEGTKPNGIHELVHHRKEPMTRDTDVIDMPIIGMGFLRKIEDKWMVEIKTATGTEHPRTEHLEISLPKDKSVLVEDGVVMYVNPKEGQPYLCSKDIPHIGL